ncbi:MAG: glycosyltransferase family 8 protein [Clostridia bacterium]|nr:glycosyltransferase family 8 protein [Clostridia bacterium]
MCRKTIPQNAEIVPVFFAVDENYTPCLSVAIRSMIDHADKNAYFKIYVLVDKLCREERTNIGSLRCERADIEFVCVERKLNAIGSHLHLRDYYSQATYYRFFIPDLFPQYDKGLYLDCDILLNDDVCKIYRTNLGKKLLGAVPCDVFGRVDLFGRYAEKVLGLRRERVFNAGVILMNLAEMRRVKLEEQFVDLLARRTYKVTQDQDYLNVLCRNRVVYFPAEWNSTPFPEKKGTTPPALVHFKINCKPWHYRGIPHEEIFWKVARKTPYYKRLLALRNGYTAADVERDNTQYAHLESLAEEELELARARA